MHPMFGLLASFFALVIAGYWVTESTNSRASAACVCNPRARFQFTQLEADSARLLDESAFGMGETVTLEALGIADFAPVSDTITIRALTTKPLTPVHGSFKRLSDGSVTLQWGRRSRIDDGWRDEVEQMMAEPQEQYLVSLSADGIPFGTLTVSSASKSFSASEWGSFGISPTTIVTAQISQVGRHAQSEPLMINLT